MIRRFITYLLEIFFIVYLILTRSVPRLKRRCKNGEIILSVFFHAPSRELFYNVVKWFDRNGFSFLSVDQFHDIIANNKPFPAAAVLLTVDDGWKSNKDNIGLVANLQKVPITIFLATEFIEHQKPYWASYLFKAQEMGITDHSIDSCSKLPNQDRLQLVESWKNQLKLPAESLTIEDVRSMQDGGFVSFGAHTITHPFLPRCNDDEAFEEIKVSGDKVSNWVGSEVQSFAYPFGAHTGREIMLLKQSGYKIAFSTFSNYIEPGFNALYQVPRFEIVENKSFYYNIFKMTGVWDMQKARLKKKVKLFYPQKHKA